MPLPKIADLLVQLRAAVREFGGDQRISEMPTGPLPDDPYLLDKPRVIGASRQALVVTETPNGIRLSLAVKDGTMDVQRKELAAMYSRRKRKWRTEGKDEGRSTAELAGNPNDALETQHDE